jgi:hypothetical protein
MIHARPLVAASLHARSEMFFTDRGKKPTLSALHRNDTSAPTTCTSHSILVAEVVLDMHVLTLRACRAGLGEQ